MRKIKKTDILKAVLLLRKYNRISSKEKQIEEIKKYLEEGILTPEDFWEWTEELKKESTTEEAGEEYEESETYEIYETYTSSTGRDYSPSNPWDAPGMSIYDFI